MTGTASSQLRSAIVAETTPGTIVSTPGFTTLHRPLELTATPSSTFSRSLISGGARLGRGISGIPVAGRLSSAPIVYGVWDALLATVLQGAWASDVLKDGKAFTTVTCENTMPAGVGGTATMTRFRGVEGTGATLRLTSGQEATIDMDLVGMGSDDATTTAIAGATYTDPSEADPLSSGSDVGTIAFNGYTLDCFESMEIAFTYENKTPQAKIGSDDLCGVTRGDLLPAITANAYIESNFLEIYNASRARHTAFSVTIPLGSVTGEKYTIVFPTCYFGSAPVDVSGTNLMQTIQIMPVYDATTEDAVVKITRAVT